jgi:hypothetical protein
LSGRRCLLEKEIKKGFGFRMITMERYTDSLRNVLTKGYICAMIEGECEGGNLPEI